MRPLGDRVAAGDQVVHGLRRLEEGVRHAAIAGVGRQQQLVLALVVVKRVVEARDHARGVAEGRMRGDVLDPLAVDVDVAVVAQRLQIFRAGLRSRDFDVARVLRRNCRLPRFPAPCLPCHRDLPVTLFDYRTTVRIPNFVRTIRPLPPVGKGQGCVRRSSSEICSRDAAELGQELLAHFVAGGARGVRR